MIQTVLLELQQLTPERPTRRNEHETRTVSGAGGSPLSNLAAFSHASRAVRGSLAFQARSPCWIKRGNCARLISATSILACTA